MNNRTLFSLIILFVMSFPAYTQSITVATYNIRYNIPMNYKYDSTRGEDWERRGPAIAALIRYHKFEIFGTQEGMLHQLKDIESWVPGFTYVGVGRDDGEKAGEHAAIFYKTSRFKVMDTGDFWLSETPDEPSKGWDATCCNRLCSWALFEDLGSGKQFFVFNAHFDHQGVEARKESSKLILTSIHKIAGDKPVIFMGDLNGDHKSEWYLTIRNSNLFNDTFLLTDDPYTQNGSFNGFGRRTGSKSIIDHVFVSQHFNVTEWGIITDTYHGKFPSDHFPVSVHLDFK